MPQDARYGVTEVAFYVQSGLDSPKFIGRKAVDNRDAVDGLVIPVPIECFRSSGAKVYMEISDLFRVNFKGEKIIDNRVTLYEKTFTFIAQ